MSDREHHPAHPSSPITMAGALARPRGALRFGAAVGVTLAVTAALLLPSPAATAATTATGSTTTTTMTAAAPRTTTTTYVLAALGDSVTRAASADGTGADNTANSWSSGSGDLVWSHLDRLADRLDTPVRAVNLALSGSTSADLPRQASLAVSSGADYVTILSGANNICQSSSASAIPSASSYAADVRSALSRITSGLPGVRILVASIPSLMTVYLTGRDYAAATNVWAAAKICPVMLANPQDQSPAAVARRQSVEQAVVEYNAAAAEVCSSTPECFADDGAVHDLDGAVSDLNTRDYFHPSLSAQNRIADATWNQAVSQGVFGGALGAPSAAVTDDDDQAVDYTATWGRTASSLDDGGTVRYATATPASYSLTFTGSVVSIENRSTSSSGISEVRIDDVLVATIDGYASSSRYRVTAFTSSPMVYGEHTITVTSSKQRNAKSTGTNLILDAFIVTR